MINHNNSMPRMNSSFQSFEQKSFIESVNGFKIYKLQLNVVDFKAQHIKIHLNGFSLSISGFYESDAETPNTVKKTKRFNRDIKLPEFIDLNRMRSYLLPDQSGNILTIEAPVIQIDGSEILTPKLKQRNQNNLNSSNRSILHPCETHEISTGILKYKFSLKEYRPQDISICIKDGRKLLITALNESFDHYGKMCREFVREINLPQDVDPYKIKNCYDPVDGILRIEIPLSNLKDVNYSNRMLGFSDRIENENKFEKMNLNEDHLELAFDLTEYNLNNVKILQQQKSNILQITANKNNINYSNNSKEKSSRDDCEKKVSYLLPNWVDCNNYKVYKKALDNNSKNIIVVKLPILKQFLTNGDGYNNNNNENIELWNSV